MTTKNLCRLLLITLAVFLTVDAIAVYNYRKHMFKMVFGVERPESPQERFAVTMTVSNTVRRVVLLLQTKRAEVDTILQEASQLPETTIEERRQKKNIYELAEKKKVKITDIEIGLYRIACYAEDGGLKDVAASAGARPHFMYNDFRDPRILATFIRIFLPA